MPIISRRPLTFDAAFVQSLAGRVTVSAAIRDPPLLPSHPGVVAEPIVVHHPVRGRLRILDGETDLTPQDSQPKRSYEAPALIAYGSISAHTFTRAGGGGPKMGDWQVCTTDKFGEYSCSSHGFS
jgi:hypothetical protein